MLTIISPAKKQDFSKSEVIDFYTLPNFLSESQILIDHLQKLSQYDIALLMSVSENIAALNYKRYRDFKLPFDQHNAKQAVLAFKGDVYAGLAPESFTQDDFMYAQKSLRILSGLYGLLKPLDLIQPYRLEMKTELSNSKGKNLYIFWGRQIAEKIEAELVEVKNDILINLASEEYFKVIDTTTFKGKIITPVFKEYKEGEYRVIGLLAKRARGMMSRYIIKNRINRPEDLLAFQESGYQFNKALSDEKTFVFTR